MLLLWSTTPFIKLSEEQRLAREPSPGLAGVTPRRAHRRTRSVHTRDPRKGYSLNPLRIPTALLSSEDIVKGIFCFPERKEKGRKTSGLLELDIQEDTAVINLHWNQLKPEEAATDRRAPQAVRRPRAANPIDQYACGRIKIWHN